jgi:hypothetical protein
MTRETGRGGDCATDTELEDYCNKVIDDYLRMLKMAKFNCDNFFKNKVIVEYGPGDFLGVSLNFLMLGAKRIYCIDRFPLKDDRQYQKLYNKLLNNNNRLGDTEQNFWQEILGRQIFYIPAKDGVHVLPEQADLIISRAVLEHCNSLKKTFANMDQNLNPHGLMIHKVDLTSHDTHYKTPLDFLCYTNWIWRLMTSRKGYPNRWRRNTYQELLKGHSFNILHEESLFEFSKTEVSSLRPQLAVPFRDLPDEELLCSDYFFVAQKK